MSDEVVIPTSYGQWRQFIEAKCGIKLTRSYAEQRLQELQNDTHPKTKEFARLYGNDQLERTVSWFRRAANEMS